jgi:hypothetical protein
MLGGLPIILYASLVALFLVGVVLSFKAYGRREGEVGRLARP